MNNYTLLVLFLCHFSTSAQSKFNGTFENKKYDFFMTVEKKTQNYQVKLLFQGVLYSGTATDILGYINGNYNFNSKAFNFSFSKVLGQFYFTSEGVDIPMLKTSETITALKAQPVAKTSTSSTKESNPWAERIKGKRLLYLYTGNGYSEKWFFDLCSDGSYANGDNTSYTSGGNFSATTANGGSGTWKVVANGNVFTLQLKANNGSTREFRINKRTTSNEIDLNGKRYFITQNQRCR